MNIGLVTTWFERGAAYVSRGYAEALKRQHRVFIYARGGEQSGRGDPNWDRKDVTWAKSVNIPIATFIDWSNFRRWVRTNQLDAIIFNEQHYWGTVLKATKLGVLVGAYVDYYTEETLPFFDVYDFLLCNTRRHHSVFSQHPQAIYIPWGTDCDVFRPQKRALESGAVRFFHSAGMGGVGLRKGTDIAVRAFQQVHGSTEFIIHSQVGLETYGEVADLIRRDSRISFIEATLGAPGLYQLGDVYVYPTRLEGIGLTIAEALASGLPAITTDCAPMNEFVCDGVNGRLVPVEEYRQRSDGYYWPESICSERELASAMQYFVDNPALLPHYQCRARAHAEKHLDWRKNSAELPYLLDRLARIHPKPRHTIEAAERFERERMSTFHMCEVFAGHASDDPARVRRHLLAGLWYGPKWIGNPGVWSIGSQAYLGSSLANWLRRGAHAVWQS